jgi:glycine cleavage system H lipoate-binding protein
MSIAFAVLILLLAIAVFYFRWRQGSRVAAIASTAEPGVLPPQPPIQSPAAEYDVPPGYCFHLGHTWMAEQGREMARVGLDSFAANLLGRVERITVRGEQRWVRQGQKLMTLTWDGETFEMLSPLEGVVTAINPEVSCNPQIVLKDPYKAGWVCTIKSPEMETNRRNLVQGALAASWMHNNVERLKRMIGDPDLGQDGDVPMAGLLARLSPEARKQVVSEFLLT